MNAIGLVKCISPAPTVCQALTRGHFRAHFLLKEVLTALEGAVLIQEGQCCVWLIVSVDQPHRGAHSPAPPSSGSTGQGLSQAESGQTVTQRVG